MTRGAAREGRVRAALAAYALIKKRRETLAARAAFQLRLHVERLQRNALVAGVIACVAMADDERGTVERARGWWRGSTMSGYLRGDEVTCQHNFHSSIAQLDGVVDAMRGSRFDYVDSSRPIHTLTPMARKALTFRSALDHPDLRFKVACCMYALCQEGSVKVKADVASIGESTLRKWLHRFARAVVAVMKPVYMPVKPFGEAEREHVRARFAARRGLWGPVLACDGTHTPFDPKNKTVSQDYRNYKGWTSILTVAFVDSYYRFFSISTGHAGRAGDNTVLNNSWLMRDLHRHPDKWLGPAGVVLGDSGASDNDRVFLNPYHKPHEPEKCHFNFVHSSTRFFVEQAFGVWKSRFRFLLTYMRGANHALYTRLVYASAVLHNYFMVNGGDAVEIDAGDPHWQRFFNTFASHRCPDCVAAGVVHCTHQATFRNAPNRVRACRMAPSALREVLVQELWRAAPIDVRHMHAQARARAEANLHGGEAL